MLDDNIKKNSFEKVFGNGTLICYYKLLILLQEITFAAFGKVSCYWNFVGGPKCCCWSCVGPMENNIKYWWSLIFRCLVWTWTNYVA